MAMVIMKGEEEGKKNKRKRRGKRGDTLSVDRRAEAISGKVK